MHAIITQVFIYLESLLGAGVQWRMQLPLPSGSTKSKSLGRTAYPPICYGHLSQAEGKHFSPLGAEPKCCNSQSYRQGPTVCLQGIFFFFFLQWGLARSLPQAYASRIGPQFCDSFFSLSTQFRPLGTWFSPS